MKVWNKLKCFFGWHDWDGHIDWEPQYGYCYPGPQCRRCGKWHHRDDYNRHLP